MIDYAEIVKSLREGAVSQRRETLLFIERQWSDEEQARFAAYASALSADISLDLCAVLAQTKSPRLVEILRHYAISGEPLLRERALTALQKIPDAVRHDACLALLHAGEAGVRQAACRMLATSGSRAAGAALCRCLSDPDLNVLAEAMRSLRRLRYAPPATDADILLEHPHAEIRKAAIEMAVELRPGGALPLQRLIALLAGDPAPTVRTAAAAALGGAALNAAVPALRQALRDETPAVAAAAAQALAAYPGDDTIAELLRASRHTAAAEVALSCRRALASMDASLVFGVCGRLLQDEDPLLRQQTAMALAALGIAGTGHLLSERLRVERVPAVQAALLEALGEGGWGEYWGEIRRQVHGPAEVSQAATRALAKMVDAAHLADFATILDEVEDGALHEIILQRLALLGRARPLSPELWPRLRRYLHQGSRRLAILAAEAAGAVAADTPLADLLAVMMASSDKELRRAAAASILRRRRNNLCDFLHAKRESLVFLPEIMAQMTSLGEEGAKLCHCLAALAASGEEAAKRALAIAGRLDPLALLGALREAADEEEKIALLRAWREVPTEARRGIAMDHAALLGAASPRLRCAALEALEVKESEKFIPLLVDLAVRDPDEEVRRLAAQITRRIVEGK